MRSTKSIFQTDWYDDSQNLLVWRFPESYTVEELLNAAEQLRAQVEHSGKTRFDLIVVMDKAPLDERGGVLMAFAGTFWPISVRAQRIVCVASPKLE